MNQITFNQELIDDIYSANVQEELHTIKDFLRWCYSTFNRADIYYGHGYDNAWDEAQQLVLAILHLPADFPSELYDTRLTTAEKQEIIRLVIIRIEKRIPVAYLIHRAWFCGLEFYVDERVIVPRSPISALIEQGFAGLLTRKPQRILDMCTGSGCIAIACAEHFPEADVDAVDLSFDALNVAEINIERHNLTHRVFPIQSDLFSCLLEEQYDLIVTNPPYVDLEDLSDNDGLTITKEILRLAPNYLADDGVLVCEVGNSMVHLIEQFPQVPFNWLELANGGVGVFALTKAQLLEHQHVFQ